jgi:glycosyltransferase involved in cell wall biosynthesis
MEPLCPLSEEEIVRNWKRKEDNPLVSVTVISYNHEKYIANAINGALAQITNFPIEIIIYDDASADNTQEIIKTYTQKYPAIVVSLIQKENLWLKKGINGTTTIAWPRAKGKYIAWLEGDDYWTDPLKLQKQVDFLDAHPKYSGAAHQSLVVFDGKTDQQPKLFREHDIIDIEIQHLLDGRLFHTASLVFRSEITKRYSLPTDITAYDRALFFLLATFGKIHYSNEAMCCYRKHLGGMSSWVTTEMLEKDLKIIPWISKINPDFPKHQYYLFLHLVALSYPVSLSILKVIKHSSLYVYHSFFIRPNNFRDLKMFVTYHFPMFLAKVKL